MLSNNVDLSHEYDNYEQAPEMIYTLGTQASTWPQNLMPEQLQLLEEGKAAAPNTWEFDQSKGVTKFYYYLQDCLHTALASYGTVTDHVKRKLQLTARECQPETQVQKNQAAIELLRSWRQGDRYEQRETLDYLKQALDEDRLSDRKLFS